MIAPIRELEAEREPAAAQRRKARRWIVESLMSRPDIGPRRTPHAAWKYWAAAIWVLLVATSYLVKMLGEYFVAP